MIVERKNKKFEPITITIENEKEFEILRDISSLPNTVTDAVFDKIQNLLYNKKDMFNLLDDIHNNLNKYV